MNRWLIVILMLLGFNPIVLAENANESNGYEDGVNYSHTTDPDLNKIKQEDGKKFLEQGFSGDPEQKKYYQGVMSIDKGKLMTDGINTLDQSELKQPIIDASKNKPQLKLSDPFIQNGLKLKESSVLDKNGEFCFASVQRQPMYTTKTCLQDIADKGYCTVDYRLDFENSNNWEEINEIVNFTAQGGDYNTAVYHYTPKTDGFILGYTIGYEMTGYRYARTEYNCPHRVKETGKLNFVDITTEYNDIADQKITLNKNIVLPAPYVIQKGKSIPLTFSREVTYHRNVPKLDNISYEFNNLRKLTLRIEISRKKPLIRRVRDCDFLLSENNAIPKYYQVLEKRCMINQVDAKTAQFIGEKLACYGYQEIYQKNDTENPQCKGLRQDPSCSQGKIVCTLHDKNNHCTQQQISYDCETLQPINGYQCGNTFYKDCNQSEKSKNFSEAISKLQAITEAAKDINNDTRNIKIFTGNPRHCRKAALGYNNCCADSGWGQSIGISGCDNEEKELGAAKEKGLTVNVGEYCSKKVLGVCVQKKRSYCVFSSKLAKIIQSQGRNQPLGIGFGSAKDPDCRGLLFDEFGRINFDTIDFSEFYGYLNQQIASSAEIEIKRKLGAIKTDD